MPVRIVEWQLPYTWGTGIEIDTNKVISLLLREENNLILVNNENEVYTDLQFAGGLTPQSDFAVWVTVWKVLQSDWWTQSGLVLNWKTTSGDYARWIYANDWKLYFDNGTGTWKQVYYASEVDTLIAQLDAKIDALANSLSRVAYTGEYGDVLHTPWTCTISVSAISSGTGTATITSWSLVDGCLVNITLADNTVTGQIDELDIDWTTIELTPSRDAVDDMAWIYKEVWANLTVYLFDGDLVQAQVNADWTANSWVAEILHKPAVVDNLNSTSTTDILSANQWKILNDKITDLQAIGRFLSLWDCETWQPISFPLSTPYTYITWDYFLVSNVDSTTNYEPSGSSYTGTASSTVETADVEVWDLYIYDGTTWLLQLNHTRAVQFANIAGQPTDNSNLANALADKQDALTLPATPTQWNLVVRGADNETLVDWWAIPTVPTVGNGTLTVTQNWTSVGTFTANQSWNTTIATTDTTYSAWTNVQISAQNVISATDTTYTAWEGISILNYTDYSAMQWPCATGYHVPLDEDFTALKNAVIALGISTEDWTYLKTYLKMPFAGLRSGMANSDPNGQSEIVAYWTNSVSGSSAAKCWYYNSYSSSVTVERVRKSAMSIRPFKDEPVTPDSWWTTLYSGTWNAGIFHNSTLWLISISSDWTHWITITDKNLWATTVYNDGDTLSEANCGKYYQWWNNYGFAWTGSVTNSSSQVDTTGYWPWNYYSGSTFIYSMVMQDWSNPWNDNLWGEVTWVVTYNNAITNTGVTSFNWQTWAVTYSAPVTSVNGNTWAVTVDESVISGDAWVTYTIKVSNSDPASWTASNIITFVS